MALKIITFVVMFTTFFTISFLLTLVIYKVVFLPYMDEIFHIPQAQSYCKGNFSHWNQKITTPPGLYLVSLAILQPIGNTLAEKNFCSVLLLRTVNLFFALGNLGLLFAICSRLNSHAKGFSWWKCGLTAFNLATFPTLYFFTFLYYTDAGSTFFVLFCYYLLLKKLYILSAVMGAVSLFFRQTNVIWVGFCALLAFNDLMQKYQSREMKKYDKKSLKYIQVSLLNFIGLIVNCDRREINYTQLVLDIAMHLGVFAVDVIAFGLFIVWNGGIVLGDRTSHQATLHIPQVFYFFLFTLFFASTHLIKQHNLKRFYSLFKKNGGLLISCAIIITVIVAFNTQYHHYNLSDNRHFSFYFYSKLIRRSVVIKYALVPVYMFGIYAVFSALSQSQDILWNVEYLICLITNLMFQNLLEFRYFIIGYLLFRLHLPLAQEKMRNLWLELALYTLVNIYTIYLFVMKPFVRSGDENLSRFMW